MTTTTKAPPKSLTQISHFDETAPVGPTAIILSIPEAESIIENLKSFPVEEIGSSAFMHMYGYQVERLSLQAHASAQSQDGDEFVVEGILTFQKIGTLVKTLLAIEAWRLFVLNCQGAEGEGDNDEKVSFLRLVAKQGNSLRCAFILHAEATLIGLLNLILYRKESCEEMDGETAVALVDYCARQLTALAAPLPGNEMVRRQKEPEDIEGLVKRMEGRSIADGINDARLSTEFKIAVATTSLSRHLCEHIESLSQGAQTRILDTHDFLVMVVPLIDEPPWTRRRQSSKTKVTVWEKLMDNQQWKEVAPSNLLHITKCEAQCWLTIFHLTCSNLCRQSYVLNSFRKEQLLRLRKFLNDVMLDQLPVLADVMRYMDELSLLSVPDNHTGHGSALLLQQVAMLRDELIKDRDWKDVAQQQFNDIFSKVTDATDQDLRLIAEIYNEDNISSILGDAKQEQLDSPLEGVSLSIQCEGCTNAHKYELTPKGDGKPMQSAHGSFLRTKMAVHHANDDEILLPSSMKIEAKFSFNGPPAFIKFLSMDINLPSEDSKIKWCQLGALEENLVLQLGFKPRISDGSSKLVLQQVFVSQPVQD